MLRKSIDSLRGKRGQSLSITVLVVAALAIAVFVVLSFIFFRGASDTTDTLNSCEQAGGQCFGTQGAQKTCRDYGETVLPRQCQNAQEICCTNLFNRNSSAS